MEEGWRVCLRSSLDCTPISDKCGGGEPVAALSYAQTHGITTARNYPYYFWSTQCKENVPTVARISGWAEAENEDEMARIVASHGPMIVCANFATNKNRFYHSGIAEDSDCGTEPTHALIVIGYGPDYWLLKNTYSKVWGEKGYMRVKRGVNWCGINTEKPLLPILWFWRRMNSLKLWNCSKNGVYHVLDFSAIWQKSYGLFGGTIWVFDIREAVYYSILSTVDKA